MKVNWKWDYSVYVPFCPYCDEPAYDKNCCCFCGEEYEWVEGEFKPTTVEQGDYTVVQSTNNHISIYKGDDLVSHISCTKKCAETELKGLIKDLEAIQDEM